jgi:hypothetical protein
MMMPKTEPPPKFNVVVHALEIIPAHYCEIAGMTDRVWAEYRKPLCAPYFGFKQDKPMTTWEEKVTCKRCLTLIKREKKQEYLAETAPKLLSVLRDLRDCYENGDDKAEIKTEGIVRFAKAWEKAYKLLDKLKDEST